MDVAAMGAPVEDQISEIRQSHGERFGQAIVVDDGLDLRGS
jgi:hypothetical protein